MRYNTVKYDTIQAAIRASQYRSPVRPRHPPSQVSHFCQACLVILVCLVGLASPGAQGSLDIIVSIDGQSVQSRHFCRPSQSIRPTRSIRRGRSSQSIPPIQDFQSNRARRSSLPIHTRNNSHASKCIQSNHSGQ